MNEQADISPGASNDQAYSHGEATPIKSDKRYWALAVLIVLGCNYYDVGTRWQLAGTWKCEQDNGARTVESYGFFGHQSSYSASGIYNGVTTEGRFTLNGKSFALTLSSVERADGQRLELNAPRKNIFGAKGEIKKLTSDVLEYEASTDAKSAMVSCQRQ